MAHLDDCGHGTARQPLEVSRRRSPFVPRLAAAEGGAAAPSTGPDRRS